MPRRPEYRRRRKGKRPTAAARGYGSDWKRARSLYLQENPLCAFCGKEGKEGQGGIVIAATVVDHIIPHRGNQTLFWDQSNWQSLCKRHHDEKTARENHQAGRWR